MESKYSALDEAGQHQSNSKEALMKDNEIRNSINQVEQMNPANWKKVKVGIDSGAVRSVAPLGIVENKETEVSESGKEFRAANVSAIKIYDEQVVNRMTKSGGKAGLKFISADVKKPLGAVCDVCD